MTGRKGSHEITDESDECMEKTIFLLIGEGGEYSDYWSKTIAAYERRDDAEKEAVNKKAKYLKYRELGDEWTKKRTPFYHKMLNLNSENSNRWGVLTDEQEAEIAKIIGDDPTKNFKYEGENFLVGECILYLTNKSGVDNG